MGIKKLQLLLQTELVAAIHDVSFNVQRGQQEVSEEHDHEDSHSLGLANVLPVGSDGEITHTDANLRRYPRPPH